MIRLLLVLLIAVSLATTSCFSSGGVEQGVDPGFQTLKFTVFNPNNNVRTLNLFGPETTTYGPVTYFIFGSDENMGDEANVPLQVDRKDEQQFGPMSFGEEMLDVDLSPWDGYANIYLRAITVLPNRAYRLFEGRIINITTN